MRLDFHSDSGKPCYRCDGTVFTYTCDDAVSLVDTYCHSCHASDLFSSPITIECASQASFAHRQS